MSCYLSSMPLLSLLLHSKLLFCSCTCVFSIFCPFLCTLASFLVLLFLYSLSLEWLHFLLSQVIINARYRFCEPLFLSQLSTMFHLDSLLLLISYFIIVPLLLLFLVVSLFFFTLLYFICQYEYNIE